MKKNFLKLLVVPTFLFFSGCDSAGSKTTSLIPTSDNSSSKQDEIVSQQLNQAPIATFSKFAISRDASYDGQLSATDSDGDELKYVIVTAPQHGSVILHDNGCFTYTPDDGYQGTDTFSYRASDEMSSCAVKTVTIDVNAPTIQKPIAPSNLTVTALSSTTLKLTWNDNSDNEDGFVIYKDGKPICTTKENVTTFTVSCGLDAGKSYNFEVKAQNEAGTSDSATATGTTKDVTTKPLAPTELTEYAVEETSIRLKWKDNSDNESVFDIYQDGKYIKSVSAGCDNVLICNLDLCKEYSFEVKSKNKMGESSGDTLLVKTAGCVMVPINHTPTAIPQSVTLDEDTNKTIILSGSDDDGDSLIYTVVTQPTYGILSGTAPNLTYIPEANYNGEDSFIFKVNDGKVDSNVSNVDINIVSVNDIPLIVEGDSNNIIELEHKEELSSYVRHSTIDGEVFLGGKYIELGIHKSGSFGTSGSKPDDFYGSSDDEARIGMTSDADGFAEGEDLRIDYFLPGSPEEAWNIGYRLDDVNYTATNAGLNGEFDIANYSTRDTSHDNILSTSGSGLLNDILQTDINVSFDVNDDYFLTRVILKNIGEEPINSVRFMRSNDPDNTVYMGGSYDTNNTILNTIKAGDGKAVVVAQSLKGDEYEAVSGKQAIILYYSSDDRARVATYGFSLRDIYEDEIYDETEPKGTNIIDDRAISIAFDVGTLNPNESKMITYYTSLSNRDFDEIIDDIVKDEVLTVNGSFLFTDVDLEDTHFVKVISTDENNIGSLIPTISDNITGDGKGTVSWIYNINKAEIPTLEEGQSFSEIFKIEISDEQGATIIKDITILIKQK